MQKIILKLTSIFLLFTFILITFSGCIKTANNQQSNNESQADKVATKTTGKIKIGLSIDDLRLERWQHDRDIFVQRAKQLGADVLVQSANGDSQTQYSQSQNLIAQGVDVLVIIPHDGQAIAPIVDQAHKAGIKVLAYDRLINNADVDYYVSFDNVRVGELQAQAITKLKPKGRYFLLEGSPTDNNAKLFEKGQKKVLQPLIDKGDIKIVGEQWAKDWSTQEAYNIMQNALTANNNKIDAVVAANDSTALGAVRALEEQGLAGKVPISGQDADLANCQLIVEGKQTMTVYKPIAQEATKGAEIAVALAKGEKVATNGKVNNGKIDVPSILLTPIAVDKGNMYDTIIKDGFHKLEDVYRNVPKDQWPK
ncbi:D-xylose ABC transporter substrate-binding protein [Caldanaerobius polysaccharolyticus]|uniref:D-xylose ABC transporter substrate-binding protein n=1 Tax=Caldanaerobius polysaccharolyticus TaxID=44256 RepID=UPI0004787E4B|nr:D-xylose ABC transporter substrate-binding protein [Caldanaerobius polysaccharolyticus]